MRRYGFSLMALTLLMWGCNPATIVELENNTGGELHVTVFYSSVQEIPEEALEEASELSFTIPAGECRRFSRDCDDVQAVKIDADVDLAGGFGPSNDTGVFRDGSDFGCGDVLHFTFTASITELTIDFEQREAVDADSDCTG
jgi:hypothetical protein